MKKGENEFEFEVINMEDKKESLDEKDPQGTTPLVGNGAEKVHCNV